MRGSATATPPRSAPGVQRGEIGEPVLGQLIPRPGVHARGCAVPQCQLRLDRAGAREEGPLELGKAGLRDAEPGLLEGGPAGPLDGREDPPLLAQPDLTLGRVDVDVDQHGVQVDLDHPEGMRPVGSSPAYASSTAATSARLWTRRPLTTSTRPVRVPRWLRGSLIQAADRDVAGGVDHPQLGGVPAEDGGRRVDQAAPDAAQGQPVVAPAGEPDLGLGERQVGDGAHGGGRLAALAAQEGEAGRGVVEEIAGLDGGARGACRRPVLDHLAGAAAEQPALSAPAVRLTRRRSLTAATLARASPRKPRLRTWVELRHRAELEVACRATARWSWSAGMPPRRPLTTMRTSPPALQVDVDARCPGVEGVLAELLDRGGGPLDHLAGGDGIGHLGREQADRRRHRLARCWSSASLLSASRGVSPSTSRRASSSSTGWGGEAGRPRSS